MKRRGLCFECLVPEVHYVVHPAQWSCVSATCAFRFCFAKVDRMGDVGASCACKFSKRGDFLLYINCTAVACWAGQDGIRRARFPTGERRGRAESGRRNALRRESRSFYERKPFSLVEKAVLSMRESRSNYLTLFSAVLDVPKLKKNNNNYCINVEKFVSLQPDKPQKD